MKRKIMQLLLEVLLFQIQRERFVLPIISEKLKEQQFQLFVVPEFLREGKCTR